MQEQSDFFSATTPKEDLLRWLEIFNPKNWDNLPEHLRPVPIDEKYFSKLTDEQIDHWTINNLNDVFVSNLSELKMLIDYDLKIDKSESDAAFWKFVGNPLYRMLEKRIVIHCRKSVRYKEKMFEKIDLLMNELRNDKEELRKSNEKKSEK